MNAYEEGNLQSVILYAQALERKNDELRKALFMCAAHCQGGHSDAGSVAAEMLGVPFPIHMEALVTAARREKLSPAELWPWFWRHRGKS